MKNSIKNMLTLVCFGVVACLAMTSSSPTGYTCKEEWKLVTTKNETQLSVKEEDEPLFPEHDRNLFMSGSLRAFFQ